MDLFNKVVENGSLFTNRSVTEQYNLKSQLKLTGMYLESESLTFQKMYCTQNPPNAKLIEIEKYCQCQGTYVLPSY